jgi:uncharacterized protein YndB with AHSA1/START domain
MSQPLQITVSTIVQAPVSKVWHCWTSPDHIIQWNAASDDWHCPSASNDVRVGGEIRSRMEARDGSFGFDFTGTYTVVEPQSRLVFVMGDGEEARGVEVTFQSTEDGTEVTETFVAESTHPIEMQREGWQSILNRFKAHVEASAI